MQVNNSGMMHFGIAMIGGAAGLAAVSKTSDDKVKRNMLAVATVLHAGCMTVSAFGKKKNHETKKGAITHIVAGATGMGLSIAGMCMK